MISMVIAIIARVSRLPPPSLHSGRGSPTENRYAESMESKALFAGIGIGAVCGFSLALSLADWTLAEGYLTGPSPRQGEPQVRRLPSPVVRSEDALPKQSSNGETRQIVEKSDAVSFDRIWLHIGEAFDFESGIVSESANPDDYDIYCQDIRHAAYLHCPRGAAVAIAPATSVGMPKNAAGAAQLVVDAPQIMAKRNLRLTEHPTASLVGVGFVTARSGEVYKLFIEEEDGHPDALRRQVLIVFEKVKQRENGGELRLPRVDDQLAADESTGRFLRRSAAMGKLLRSSFAQYLATGDYSTVQRIDADLSIRDQRIIIKDSVGSKIDAGSGSSIVLEGDLDPDGEIVLHSSNGLGVGGDVRGKITIKGYSHVYVRGHLTGEMIHDSYASSVIEGDLRGTLRLRSYSDVLIRGRVFGKVDATGSCWSTLYLESFMSKADLVAMQGDSSVTVHLRLSDLAPGEYKKIGAWRSVVVGDAFWNRLPPR